MSAEPKMQRHADRVAGLREVDPIAVSHILAQLDGQTDATLMTRFGISYNTWRKVRAGQPIRRSVADRLEQRLLGTGR